MVFNNKNVPESNAKETRSQPDASQSAAERLAQFRNEELLRDEQARGVGRNDRGQQATCRVIGWREVVRALQLLKTAVAPGRRGI